ncbi:MAG TPA: Smr/MutS family protein [Nitrospirota bacterium]|nr:Smr/MutS family protein [Nitrospirota bacterium]
MGRNNDIFSVKPFEKLKKALKKREVCRETTQQHVKKKKKKDVTDEELFSSEMSGVQEIGEFRSMACLKSRRRLPASEKRDPDKEALLTLISVAEGRQPIELSHTQEYVEWVNPAYRDHMIRSLREGRFSIQAFLDLHGFVVEDAEAELDGFVLDSLRKKLRCVKIIHGRGLRSVKGARIKDVVIKRLSGHFRRQVIAFVTARQCDGGLGALYVLLQQGKYDDKFLSSFVRAGLQ